MPADTYRLSDPSERRFLCYPLGILPRILESTTMYYSAIRHVVLCYSACTTPVFGRNTRVVCAEYSLKELLYGILSGVKRGNGCGKVKVAWRLNVGKKVNPDNNNSSRIYPSSIMK